jgi:hypothetical protein
LFPADHLRTSTCRTRTQVRLAGTCSLHPPNTSLASLHLHISHSTYLSIVAALSLSSDLVLHPAVPLAAKTPTVRCLLTILLSAGTMSNMKLDEFLAQIDGLTEADLGRACAAYCPVHVVG